MSNEQRQQLQTLLLNLLPADHTTVGNITLLEQFLAAAQAAGHQSPVTEDDFKMAREALVAAGLAVKGKGRGGSTARATGAQRPNFALDTPAAPASASAAKPPKIAKAKPAPNQPNTGGAQVLAYRHPDRRKNNPEVGLVNAESDPEQPKTRWAYDPHLDPALQFDTARAQADALIADALAGNDPAAMRHALQTLQRMGAPYLQWTGKAERTAFEVDTVSLHVHERIDAMSILSSVGKRQNASKSVASGASGAGARGQKHPNFFQPGLFEAPFESVPLRSALDFYKHDRGWANRLVAGDSLLVMNSLLQKEGMAGIYIDPPYGIKYGSNFQPFVGNRKVDDRKDADLTHEPEMIKAFRDTWELGIHSYLTYLRDRLLLAKELLNETGSIFVQINDENVHLARSVVEEVFGVENSLVTIIVKKKSSTSVTDAVNDYVIWYAKNKSKVKIRRLTEAKSIEDEKNRFAGVIFPSGNSKPLSDCNDDELAQSGIRFLNDDYPMVSQDESETRSGLFKAWGAEFQPGANRHWTLDPEIGMQRLVRCNRLRGAKKTVRGIVYLDDHGRAPLPNIWNFHGERDLIYVVQTNQRIVERCILMTTDPGDLVLDPTCGSIHRT